MAGGRIRPLFFGSPDDLDDDPALAGNLTAFERRTLGLFASGMPRREIAQMLNRAPKTISNSLTAAKDKLGARSLPEAAALLAAEAVLIASRTTG